MEMKSSADFGDRSNPYNEAPLLAACRAGNLVWLQELLKDDSNQVNQLFLSGKTGSPVSLLYIAAQYGHVDVVMYLIEIFSKAVEPLAEEEKLSAITAFLSAPVKDGATAFYIAAQIGHLGVVLFLTGAFSKAVEPLPEEEKLSAIRAFLSAPRKDGVTALLIAAQNGYIGIMEFLAGAYSRAVEPLAEEEKLSAIRAFLSAPHKNGVTALYIAARNGNCAVLKFLLERGIDPEQELVKCSLGKYRVFKWLFVESPLKVARESGHSSAQAILERAIQERKTAEMMKEKTGVGS